MAILCTNTFKKLFMGLALCIYKDAAILLYTNKFVAPFSVSDRDR